MTDLTESMAAFLDSIAAGLSGASWTPQSEPPQPDLQWWSCALSVDPACRFYAGAPEHVWEELNAEPGAGFAMLAEAVQQAAAARFGSQVQCTAAERCDQAPESAPAATLQISES